MKNTLKTTKNSIKKLISLPMSIISALIVTFHAIFKNQFFSMKIQWKFLKTKTEGKSNYSKFKNIITHTWNLEVLHWWNRVAGAYKKFKIVSIKFFTTTEKPSSNTKYIRCAILDHEWFIYSSFLSNRFLFT